MLTQRIEACAATLEEARTQIESRIPVGQSVLSEKVVSDGKENRSEAMADTIAGAYIKAEEQIPMHGKVIAKREIKAPRQKSFAVTAEDESEARTRVEQKITQSDVLLALELTEPSKKGFWGIGRRPNQFQAQVLEQAIVEVRWKEPVHVEAKVGFRNHGDLHDTLRKAGSYWTARIASSRKDPFVMHTFEKDDDAKGALLELPCIHEDDDGKLICTEVLVYGYYLRDDGIYEALVCGDDLSVELWEQARISFEKHGGKRKNDLKPTKHASSSTVAVRRSDEVVFAREDRTENPAAIYRVYRGPDSASALGFLDSSLVSSLVAQPLYYVVVETPKGTYGRDKSGFYKE